MLNLEGSIVKIIDKNHVILDLGSENGVKSGMQFVVFEYIQDIIHPTTKKNLGKYDVIKGKIIIKSVRDKLSIGEVVLNSQYCYNFDENKINSNQISQTTEDSEFLLIDIGDLVKLIPNPVIDAKLNTENAAPGDIITTTATFKGFLINGFFDNAIKYPKADGRGIFWNPDPKTYNDSVNTGFLQEFVDIESSWEFNIPDNAPEGIYNVSVRMYEDPFGTPTIQRRQVAHIDIPLIVVKKK